MARVERVSPAGSVHLDADPAGPRAAEADGVARCPDCGLELGTAEARCGLCASRRADRMDRGGRP